MTTYAGVVGYPVKHSLSPTMHNAGYKALGLDWQYKAIEIEPGNFNQDVKELIEQGYRGLNVTMPFKSEAYKFCDRLSENAKKLQTVNTIVVDQNGVATGSNTDGDGFVLSLTENNVSIPGLEVLVIGAGGASKAICYALVEQGANVYVTARSPDQANEVVEISQQNSSGKISTIGFEERNEKASKVQLIVNATPIGMTMDGKASEEVPLDTSMLNREQIVVDTIYYPIETELLKQSSKLGCKVFNGIEMLLYQGAIAFSAMTGQVAPVSDMKKALLENLK